MPRHSTITPEVESKILWFSDLGLTTRKIARYVHRSHVTVWRVLQARRKQLSVTKQTVTELAPTRDLSVEVSRYQPAMRSSFGGGLGAGTPQNIVNKAVKDNSRTKDFKQFRAAKWQLCNLISEKKLNPLESRFREALKKRVSALGFDSSSDNDIQFGQLNDMAAVGLAALRIAGEQKRKLKIQKLVDASILYRRPDWKAKLEESKRRLRCGRCRRQRSFLKNKDGKSVTCLACGLETPVEKARFHISIRRLDPVYVDLVHSAVVQKECA